MWAPLFFNESGVVQGDKSGLRVLLETVAGLGCMRRVSCAMSVGAPAVRVVPCRRAVVPVSACIVRYDPSLVLLDFAACNMHRLRISTIDGKHTVCLSTSSEAAL